MRCLLDTQALLWLAVDPARLGAAAPTLRTGDTELLLSAVVLWEIAIKTSGRRYDLGMPVEDFVLAVTDRFQLQHLAVTWQDTASVAELPLHHRDPFDRLLVAQARRHGLVLATADRQLAAYDVEVLPLG